MPLRGTALTSADLQAVRLRKAIDSRDVNGPFQANESRLKARWNRFRRSSTHQARRLLPLALRPTRHRFEDNMKFRVLATITLSVPATLSATIGTAAAETAADNDGTTWSAASQFKGSPIIH
jgi:hypothetical protein